MTNETNPLFSPGEAASATYILNNMKPIESGVREYTTERKVLRTSAGQIFYLSDVMLTPKLLSQMQKIMGKFEVGTIQVKNTVEYLPETVKFE